jgi:hypothetical protein
VTWKCRTHNPEVAGSNPARATREVAGQRPEGGSGTPGAAPFCGQFVANSLGPRRRFLVGRWGDWEAVAAPPSAEAPAPPTRGGVTPPQPDPTRPRDLCEMLFRQTRKPARLNEAASEKSPANEIATPSPYRDAPSPVQPQPMYPICLFGRRRHPTWNGQGRLTSRSPR